MIKALIFDFDGVILESVDVKGWAFQKIFDNYPEIQERILSYHYANGGVPRSAKIRHILTEFVKVAAREDDVARLCQRFSELVFDRVVNSPFVPGAPQVLAGLSKLYKLYIASGTPIEEMCRIVEAKNLGAFFAGVYGSPVSKGDWTKRILLENKISSREVVWIGDAFSDWEAAQENGISFVLRSWSGNTELLKEINPARVIKDLQNLPEVIKTLNQEK